MWVTESGTFAAVSVVRRFVEGLAFLGVGLLLGWFLVTVAPFGTGGPVIIATLLLAVGGRLMFDGTFAALGYGLTASTLVTVGFYVRDLADVGS